GLPRGAEARRGGAAMDHRPRPDRARSVQRHRPEEDAAGSVRQAGSDLASLVRLPVHAMAGVLRDGAGRRHRVEAPPAPALRGLRLQGGYGTPLSRDGLSSVRVHRARVHVRGAPGALLVTPATERATGEKSRMNVSSRVLRPAVAAMAALPAFLFLIAAAPAPKRIKPAVPNAAAATIPTGGDSTLVEDLKHGGYVIF